jgi:hypothetical protein
MCKDLNPTSRSCSEHPTFASIQKIESINDLCSFLITKMWTLDKKVEKKIEALEMWIYRRMGKIIWSEKKTNNEILKQLKLKRKLFNPVCKRQMKFFGHTKRHFERHFRRKDLR